MVNTGLPKSTNAEKAGSFTEKPEALHVENELTLETKEILAPAEQERLKKEVLQEIDQAEKAGIKQAGPVAAPKAPVAEPKSPTLVKIESILEQDLQDAYLKMDPVTRQKFKTEGEKTAAQIEQILSKTKIKVKKILKLILNWLKIIPGVNKFFIQQEVKIKTDKIMKLKQ